MKLTDLNFDATYTYKDYYSWDFPERVELINGRVLVMDPVTYTTHQTIVGELLGELWTHLNGKQGKVFAAPFDVRFPEGSRADEEIKTVLQPDLCVICDKTNWDDRGGIGVPDIVIEVLIAGNNVKEIKDKFDVYEKAGVKEYWIVSPQNYSFLINILVNNKYVTSRLLTVGDVVTTDILPGFELDLKKMFDTLAGYDFI